MLGVRCQVYSPALLFEGLVLFGFKQEEAKTPARFRVSCKRVSLQKLTRIQPGQKIDIRAMPAIIQLDITGNLRQVRRKEAGECDT